MDAQENTKPSYDEWMYWTQVIVDRLTTVTHVYAHPPFPEVFMAEREKQQKLSKIVDLMGRLHHLTDGGELGMIKNMTEADAYIAEMIEGIQPLYKEVLACLPLVSQDMQKLLKSSWYYDCAGKLANNLFCGPQKDGCQGIGSGMPENGRLPSVIEDLLDREASGTARAPRIERPRFTAPLLRREEIAKLWGQRNSAYMRSAGRVD